MPYTISDVPDATDIASDDTAVAISNDTTVFAYVTNAFSDDYVANIADAIAHDTVAHFTNTATQNAADVYYAFHQSQQQTTLPAPPSLPNEAWRA